MPHVIVKLWPGKSEPQKKRLAQAITKDVTTVLNYGISRCRSIRSQKVIARWMNDAPSRRFYARDDRAHND